MLQLLPLQGESQSGPARLQCTLFFSFCPHGSGEGFNGDELADLMGNKFASLLSDADYAARKVFGDLESFPGRTLVSIEEKSFSPVYCFCLSVG
jgi:hypothetical protein